MGKSSAQRIIEEAHEAFKAVGNTDGRCDTLINFHQLAYMPFINVEIANRLPNVVIATLAIMRQPLFCKDRATIEVLEERYKKLESNPLFLERVRQELSRPGVVLI